MKMFIFFLITWTMVSYSHETKLSDRQAFSSSDFLYDMLAAPVTLSTSSGNVRAATVDEMPVLQGEGVSFTLFTLESCGINLPHVHPRATELLYVISGNNLRTGQNN